MTLIGDAFLEQKNTYDAVISYMDVYRLAQGEAREDALEKIKQAISGLAESEIRILIQQWGKDRLAGYLLLQLAELYARQGREADALEVLSELLRDFPKHELTGAATEFMVRLKKSLDIDKGAIGCILPLTGPYEQFGNCVLAGIELALAEFNSGPVATPIRLVIKDSRGDPEVAARALEYLVHNENVVGIIGPMVTAEYVAESAQNLGVPIITLTQKEDITKIGDFVFRDFLTPLQQIKTIVPYVVHTLGYKKLAIIYPDDISGIRFMNLFWDELIEQGGQVVGVESYNSHQTDFATPIKKLIGRYYERIEPVKVTGEEIMETTIEEEIADEEVETEEPEEPEPIIDFDAVFIPDTSKNVSLIAPQLLYNDVTDVLLLGTNLWYSPWLLRQSAGYVQGAIFSTGFFVEDPNPTVQNFVANFQETFGRKPIFFDAQGYDIAKLLFHGVQQPKVRTRKGLQVALHQVSGFPTVTGFISFDETGDARKELILLKVRGKRFVQIR
jgi:ABC-type branched-subunit amino acid transport system substrate-binding protein